METTNKCFRTFAVIAVLILASIPAQAEFGGTLFRNNPTNVFTITNNSSSNEAAVTIYYLDDRGIDLVMFESVPPAQQGNGTTIVINLPRFGRVTKRVMLEVDVPPLGGAAVMVNGTGPLCFGVFGCGSAPDVITGRLVFNVV